LLGLAGRVGAQERSMANKNIQSALLETRSFPPPPAFAARARIKPADLENLRKRARDDHVGFWADLASQELAWHTPFTVTLDDAQAPNYRWFSDGRLNASFNCLDVHLNERGHKTAVIFEGEPGDVRRLSYRELHAQVRSEEHTSELQSPDHLVCRLLLEKKKTSMEIH